MRRGNCGHQYTPVVLCSRGCRLLFVECSQLNTLSQPNSYGWSTLALTSCWRQKVDGDILSTSMPVCLCGLDFNAALLTGIIEILLVHTVEYSRGY